MAAILFRFRYVQGNVAGTGMDYYDVPLEASYDRP